MWTFIEQQIMAMHWLNDLIGSLIVVLGGNLETPWGRSVQFFFFDTIKITFLLCFLIFIISWIQSYFPPERTRRLIGNFRGVSANVIAAMLGAVTPFCSCSSIPLFVGFTGAGLPMGVTFSFLIASPMVDIGSLMVLSGLIGLKVAVLYIFLGITIAVIGGTIIEKLKLERYLEGVVVRGSAAMATAYVKEQAQASIKGEATSCSGMASANEGSMSTKARFNIALSAVISIFRKVFPYILLGVGIGASINNYIPKTMVESVLGADNPLSVVIATLIGIPVYADIFGVIPIAEALLAKGVTYGTVISFMMAVTVLSVPSLIMLRKAIKWQLLGIFVGLCTLGIIITGYLFNLVAPWF